MPTDGWLLLRAAFYGRLVALFPARREKKGGTLGPALDHMVRNFVTRLCRNSSLRRAVS
jgi:hypothetical protein